MFISRSATTCLWELFPSRSCKGVGWQPGISWCRVLLWRLSSGRPGISLLPTNSGHDPFRSFVRLSRCPYSSDNGVNPAYAHDTLHHNSIVDRLRSTGQPDKAPERLMTA